jgi:hypothetical protein
MGSLVGKVPAEFILNSWTRGNMSVLVVAVCLLVIISVVLHTRMTRLKDCHMVKIICGCFCC